MPKLVCVKCQCELRPETNDTTVIETAKFGPYKIWDADTWKCPGCGIEVVALFNFAADHQFDFNDAVTAWYLLARDTIDEEIMKLIDQKRIVVDAATEGGEAERVGVLNALVSKLLERE